MGSGTKKLPFERSTTYEWQGPPDTADINAVRNYDDMPETLQPALEAQYNRAKERNANRYRSLYNQGGMTTAARLASESEADRGLTADYGASLGQAAFNAKQQGLQRRMFLASLTAPRPLATKESGYQSEKTDGFFGSLLKGAAAAAPYAALALSDKRLKTNIKPQSSVLGRLGDFEAKEWDWRDGSGHQAGVVAQDVQQQFPEAVQGEPDGDEPMRVDYGDPSLAATALQGVKELNQKVNSLMRQRQLSNGARRM